MTRKERLELKTINVVAIVALLFVAGCDRCACSNCGDNSSTTTTPTKPDPPSGGVDLTLVPLIPQQTSKWCWAASAEMTMKAVNRDVRQCEQATHALTAANAATVSNPVTVPNCCAPATLAKLTCPDPDESNPCATTGWPDYKFFNFGAEATDEQALSWDELTGELLAGRPVAFSWRTEEGGHMMVALAFQTEGKMVQ